jgi:hypothetical protein
MGPNDDSRSFSELDQIFSDGYSSDTRIADCRRTPGMSAQVPPQWSRHVVLGSPIDVCRPRARISIWICRVISLVGARTMTWFTLSLGSTLRATIKGGWSVRADRSIRKERKVLKAHLLKDRNG